MDEDELSEEEEHDDEEWILVNIFFSRIWKFIL